MYRPRILCHICTFVQRVTTVTLIPPPPLPLRRSFPLWCLCADEDIRIKGSYRPRNQSNQTRSTSVLRVFWTQTFSFKNFLSLGFLSIDLNTHAWAVLILVSGCERFCILFILPFSHSQQRLQNASFLILLRCIDSDLPQSHTWMVHSVVNKASRLGSAATCAPATISPPPLFGDARSSVMLWPRGWLLAASRRLYQPHRCQPCLDVRIMFHLIVISSRNCNPYICDQSA